jgi:hypothetical protein
MREYTNAGGFVIPDSEASYGANGSIADMVYPHHGGTLQADGSWTQDAGTLASDFSQGLPATARAAGQLYMPGVGANTEGVKTVMDSAALMQTAAENLVDLATVSRFDSPWDGVSLNIEVIRLDYRDRLNAFLTILSDAIRAAGLPVNISVKGKRIDGGDWIAGSFRYTQDYTALDAIADWVDMRCYGYPGEDYSFDGLLDYISPYDWVKDCVTYALSAGIPASKLMLGVGNFSRYWPTTGVDDSVTVVHADAITLCDDELTYPLWVETDASGRVREEYAVVDTGHVWVHDHNVFNHELALADESQLLGVNLFTPGMGTADIWTVLGDWLPGYTPWHGYISVSNLNLAGADFTALLAIVEGQGRLSNPQPSNITHSRVISATETVVEAVFRYGEMAQDQCIQWVAAVLDVDPADVTLGVAANVWTVTHGGTDYVTFNLFGGLDSSWINSGAACRTYIG